MALRAAELTDAIETAFAAEWGRIKGIPLPSAGSEDRRMLFAAVAIGLLAYLDAHEGDMFNSITFEREMTSDTWQVERVDLDIA